MIAAQLEELKTRLFYFKKKAIKRKSEKYLDDHISLID